jgi:6 kDa early secretory antigenic target
MSEIKVNFQEIAAASQSINTTSNTLDSLLSDLKSNLAPIGASYTGAASEAWQEKQRQWDTAYADLRQVLSSIAAAVGQAGENYQATEQANTNRWG